MKRWLSGLAFLSIVACDSNNSHVANVSIKNENHSTNSNLFIDMGTLYGDLDRWMSKGHLSREDKLEILRRAGYIVTGSWGGRGNRIYN